MPEQFNTPLDAGPLETVGQNVLAAGPLGTIWVAWVPEGVTMIELRGAPADAEAQARWLPEIDGPIPEAAIPSSIYETLSRYFEGAPVDPARLPVRIRGTKFQRRAWRALRDIERGSVRTYAGLAKDAGSPKASRAVGMAMGANPIPILVPCHRCVAAGFTLGGYSGGLDKKRILLELEGVQVQGDQVMPGQLDLL